MCLSNAETPTTPPHPCVIFCTSSIQYAASCINNKEEALFQSQREEQAPPANAEKKYTIADRCCLYGRRSPPVPAFSCGRRGTAQAVDEESRKQGCRDAAEDTWTGSKDDTPRTGIKKARESLLAFPCPGHLSAVRPLARGSAILYSQKFRSNEADPFFGGRSFRLSTGTISSEGRKPRSFGRRSRKTVHRHRSVTSHTLSGRR